MIYESTVLGARWAIPRALVYGVTRLESRHGLSVYAHETTRLSVRHAVTPPAYAVSRLAVRHGVSVLTHAVSSLAGRWSLTPVTAAATQLGTRWALPGLSFEDRSAGAAWALSVLAFESTVLSVRYGLAPGSATLLASWPVATGNGTTGATGAGAWPGVAITATGSGEWGRLAGDLPAVSLSAATGARAAAGLALPAVSLSASTRATDGVLTAAWPAVSLTAFGAADGGGAWPAVAVASAWAEGAGAVPAVSLEASAWTPWTASLQATVYGLLGAAGYAGAVLAGECPAFAATGEGQSGGVGRLTGTLPGVSLYASALSGSTAALEGSLPLFGSASVIGLGTLPAFHLCSVPGLGLSLGVEVSASAPVNWCVNAETGETSSYTHFPFQRVVRFAGGYYAINAGGLYALGGNLDVLSAEDSSTITATVQSAPEDFSTHQHKRVPTLYVGMTAGEAAVQVIVDGTTHGPFTSSDGQRKVKLPRGALGRYWSFKLQNVTGGEMKVDGIEAVVETIRRRV